MEEINPILAEKLSTAPLSPGCYIYRNSNDKIIYVGKAKNIRRRVNQYFTDSKRLDPKTRVLVQKIDSVEFIVTDSEIDALVLEANLIKKYRPKYNKLMKDDKRYVWVAIDKSKDYPVIFFTRDKKNPSRIDYFGPFPNKFTIIKILKRLRKIFPYCERPLNKKVETLPKPCFYYHIGLCNGACIGEISKEEYRSNINKIASILRGNSKEIVSQLQTEMVELSNNRQFEEAAKVRDKIKDFNYIRQQHYIDYGMDEERVKLLKDIKINKGLEKFVEGVDIDGLEIKDNFKIECYDISNIQGKNAVGSMVVFVNGKKASSLYRKFKIKIKDTPDDFAMMKEVLRRRLKRLDTVDNSFGIKPDLIIVDGGKGQLSSAFSVLHEENIDIPIVGLAKREEEIFKIELDENSDVKFKRKKLRDGSEELFLIQRIRDEAHRFAITYHRKLRSKAQILTTLDTIPGVGPVTKKKLLQKFGSWSGIKKASKKDLEDTIRNKSILREILRKK